MAAVAGAAGLRGGDARALAASRPLQPTAVRAARPAMLGVTTVTTATLLLAAVTLSAALTNANPPPRAAAGVAGGAGAAELAEREVPVVDLNGSLGVPAPTEARTTGTIREALGGGVVDPATMTASSTPALSPGAPSADRHPAFGAQPQPQPGGLRSSGSRCTGPQVCLRVEHCQPAEVDLLFECAPGWVCCVPAPPSRPPSTAASPTSSPRPSQGAQGHAGHAPNPATATPPTPQRQPQLPRPTPSHAAPAAPQDHHHHVEQQQHQPATQRPLHLKPEEGLTVPVQRPPAPAQHSGHPKPQATATTPPSATPPSATSTTRPGPHATTAAASAPKSLLPGTDVCGIVTTENRITNGKIASPGQFPWMAILGYRRRGDSGISFLCGGTLINEKYILTAAHCISSQNRPVLVRLGEFNLTEAVDCDHDKVCAPPPLDMDVESISSHPDFDLRNIKHDIALIRLSRSVHQFSEYVRPICLPVNVNVTDDKKFKIAGWGKTYFRDAAGSPVLQFTDVNGVGHAECNELQPPELQPLDPGQLCAGGDKGKDACKGDSGGPLMVTLANEAPTVYGPNHVTYQIGVVSYGPDSPCGTAPLPSIYTRVTAYVPWILATLRP